MKPSIGSETKPIEHLYVKHLHTDKDFIPVGTILAYSANGTIPSGYLLCDGAAVSRTMYSDLFSVIGTTYGAGDGSTTFNLPDLTDKFIEGSAAAGTVKQAGLPNIKGSYTAGDAGNSEVANANAWSGAVYTGKFQSGRALSTYSNGGYITTTFFIDASRSNAIYGASDTVQPPALTARYIIKYK